MAEPSRPSVVLRGMLWVIGVVVVLLLVNGIAVVLTTSSSIDIMKSKAQLGCQSVAIAIEKYVDHEANKKHEFPAALHDLVKPPFGGPSLLRDGDADLLDPWGKQYEMERRRRSDDTEYVIVKTTAPDGTPISQFGIGPNSVPRE